MRETRGVRVGIERFNTDGYVLTKLDDIVSLGTERLAISYDLWFSLLRS